MGRCLPHLGGGNRWLPLASQGLAEYEKLDKRQSYLLQEVIVKKDEQYEEDTIDHTLLLPHHRYAGTDHEAIARIPEPQD
jgi:hypothetical protein